MISYLSKFGEMSERFKEPVLKTGDPATGRGFESHSLRHFISFRTILFFDSEWYPRGRRGSPAKGVGVQKAREGSNPSHSATLKHCEEQCFFFVREASAMIIEGYIPYLDHQTYYRVVGDPASRKTPLLMLHGGPGSTHNYYELLDFLAEEDGRLFISYDQIGCGKSYLDGHPELWSMETWIGELKAVRRALGLEEVILLGQSWGGMLLLEYLCRHEHAGVRGAVLSSTLPSSRLWGEEQARMIRQLPAEAQEAIREATERNDYSAEAYKAAEALYMALHASGKPGPDAPDCLT